MSWGAVAVGGVTAIGGMFASSANKRAADKAAREAEAKRAQEQKKLDVERAKYKSMEFENVYEDMENVFEDLTVNQQQAQFEAQQGMQQRADIMQNLRGAAGASGVAGLAQAMAGSGQLATQAASASIGQQEAANQRQAAMGAQAVQTAKLGGEQWVQQAEIGRQETLLGMQMGAASGANVAHQQAQANQMNAQIAQQQSLLDLGGVAAQAAGGITDKMKAEGTGFYKPKS